MSQKEGGRRAGERERRAGECVTDRDGGAGAGGRRWRGAISVTSHLAAPCFSGRRLVRGRESGSDAAGWMQPGGLCSHAAHLSLPEGGRKENISASASRRGFHTPSAADRPAGHRPQGRERDTLQYGDCTVRVGATAHTLQKNSLHL